MGAFTFLVSTVRPLIWSEWSWVIKMPDSSSGSMPSSRSPVVMRRAEMPASSKTWVAPQEMTAALPLEPLAKVVNLSITIVP